ncbi:MAG: HpcH/HpaI aldolase/citrate lyase family protein, partial [Anaeromassilibacillus sp.]
EEAVLNVEKQLSDIRRALLGGSLSRDRLPLLFVRVKDVDMLERLAGLFVENSPVLTVVILPKTTRESLQRALSIVETINQEAKEPFYIMPILESVELMLCDDRISLLRSWHPLRNPF